MQNLGERVARLEEHQASSKPMHDEFRLDIMELKEGQAEIKTTLKLLVVNGRGGKLRAIFPYGGGVSFLAGLAAVLKFLG
jgi:hypothetical protein